MQSEQMMFVEKYVDLIETVCEIRRLTFSGILSDTERVKRIFDYADKAIQRAKGEPDGAPVSD